MEQKLLLLISMLLLLAFNANAETASDLPALPIGSSVELVEPNKEGGISFWQKFLNFFGFSNKEEKNSESPSADTMTDIPEFDSSKLQIKRLDEDDSVPKVVNNLGSKKATSDDKTLPIPEGFEEDGPLKLPKGISELIEAIDTEAVKDTMDSIHQLADYSKEKLQEAGANPINKNSDPQINNNQKAKDSGVLKLPDGFDSINDEYFQPLDTPRLEGSERGLKKPEEKIESFPLEPTNKSTGESFNQTTDADAEAVSAIDIPPGDSAGDLVKTLTLPANDIYAENEPVINTPENGIAENNPILDKELPTPNYASALDTPQKPESSIERFTKVFTNKNEKQIEELPRITEEDYNTNEKGEIKKESVEIDPIQLQFINNEAQVLILPNDDVVLGELTNEAKVNEMNLYSYINLFWKNYSWLRREPQREAINRFIEEYDENFNQGEF